MMEKRDRCLDIIKGMGIILMVFGHSGGPFTHYIYLFHMAVFFTVSGFLWKDDNVRDISSCKSYVIRKLKTLWLPYFVCNTCFILLNNAFVHIGIYTNNKDFLILPIGPNDHLTEILNLKQIAVGVVKAFFFAGGTQLGAAMWFLRTLFFVSIANMIIRFVSLHFKGGSLITVLSVIFCAVCAQIVSSFDIALPLGMSSFFSAYIAFYIGILFRKHKNSFIPLLKHSGGGYICILLSVIILIILGRFGSISIDKGEISNIFFFIIVSIAGWMLLYCIAGIVNNTFIADTISFLGKHTIWILILHFLSFKLVSLMYIKLREIDFLYLAMFPVITDDHLWPAYLLAGVVIPIGLRYVILRIYYIIYRRKIKQ